MRTVPRRRTAALAATAGLLLAACGSGADEAAEPAAATAEALDEDTPADADEPAPEDDAPEDITDDASNDDASTTEAEPEATEEPPAANAAVLSWTATDLDGAPVAGTSFAGGDVLLWMWAPWCSICNREAPAVASLLDDYDDAVEIVGVAGRDELPQHRGFVDKHGLGSMATVVDVDGGIWASYGISYQPAWVFIDEDGAAQVVPGALGEDRLRELLDELVAT